MTTRERIIACAEALFREKGYNSVSMREIAEKAGIRVGNLTYYYSRKELLVEAVFSPRGTNWYTPEALSSVDDFRDFFRHMLGVQRKHSFYFDSYIQLSQTSAYFHAIQCGRMDQLRGLFLAGLQNLAAAGEIAPEPCEGEFARRVETILTALMLRLPGQERQFAPPEQDEAVLQRLMDLLR